MNVPREIISTAEFVACILTLVLGAWVILKVVQYLPW